jgi:hypothetical protein
MPPISGPVEMGHEQIAAQLSEALGHKIVFQDEVAAGTCWIGLLSPSKRLVCQNALA